MAQSLLCDMKDIWNFISSYFKSAIWGPLVGIPKNLETLAQIFSGTGTGNNSVDSLVNQITQAGPTGRDEWLAQREDTANQRAVADMEAAGLNVGLMYGHGQPASSSTASGQGASLSDLLALAMLPLEMKKKEADIENTKADTENTKASTRTQEQETLLRALMVEYYPKMSDVQIDKLIADVDLAYASVSEKAANTDYIHSRHEAQDIVNNYLDARSKQELDNLIAEHSKIEQETKYAEFKAKFTEVQYKFAKKNGFLMSSSDTLQLAVYIASLFGLSTESVASATQSALEKVRQELESNPHFFDE